uniref:CwfJ_C_1 domain-containing protein n=2 Tax=Mesocestoides corti TaxID=53468 RepID=A0A5K3FCF8_MESCO
CRNHRVLEEREKLVTRFIGLAKVGNTKNLKYLYALKIKPVDKMSRVELVAQPPDVTENPYFETIKQRTKTKPKETEVQTDQYFYAVSQKRGAGDGGGRRKMNWKLKKYEKQDNLSSTDDSTAAPSRVQEACWFCLGNPQVAKHLLVTIATHAYLALPRGPLVKDHVLILTVGHHQSWLTCPEVVQADIEAYKKSLRSMYKAEGKVMVAFERNFKTHHYQLQVVPVPFAVAGEVKKAFIEMSESWPNSPCKLEPLPKSSSIKDFCKPGIPYFYVELPTGEKLFNKVEKDRLSVSDVNFGRAVLASKTILNCPERINWRECTEDEATETELTANLREKFTAFDFA